MIAVVARIRAKAGGEEELYSILKDLISPTRREAGCLRYDLHRSLQDRKEFMFYEQWSSQAALDLHLATPHIRVAFQKAESLLDGDIAISSYSAPE